MATVAEFFAVLGLKPDVDSFQQGSALLDKVREGAGRLAGVVAGAFAADAIKDFVVETIGAIPAIGDLAAQTGIAAEQIQRLGYAASQSGADAETLNAGLLKFVGNLGNAAAGSEPVLAALKRLGVSTSDIAKQDPADVLAQVSDGLSRVGSVAERAALAQDLFGLSGKKLAPFLSVGSDAMREMGDEAERLGLVISAETIGQVDALDDRVGAVGATLKGAARTLVIAALPALESLADLATLAAKAAVRLAKAVKDNIGVLKVVAGVVSALLVGAGLRWIATLAATVVAQVAAIASNSTLAASYGIVAGFIDVASLAALKFIGRMVATAAPIVIAAAAAALLFFVFEDIYTAINGGDSLLAGFVGRFDELAEVMYAAAGDEGAGFFSRVLSGVGVVIAGVLHVVDSLFVALFDGAGVFISFNETLLRFFVSPIETAREVLTALIVDISKAIATISQQAGRLVGAVAGPLGSIIGEDRVRGIAAGLSGVTAGGVASTALSSPVVRAAAGVGGNVTVGAPTVSVTVNGGGDPDRIGAAVAEAVGPTLEQTIRAARVDIIPGGG